MCIMYDYICGNCDRGHITEASAELVQCKKKREEPNKNCGKWDRKKKKVKNDFCKAGEEKKNKKKNNGVKDILSKVIFGGISIMLAYLSGSSGFALQLAQTTAARGDRVLGASRSTDKVKGLADQESMKLLRSQDSIISIQGTIDIVVNNAAYVQTGTIEEASPDHTPSSTATCNASNAALRWVAPGLADEVRGFGIRHCLVEPGFFPRGTAQAGRQPRRHSANGVPSRVRRDQPGGGWQLSPFDSKQLGGPVKGAAVIYEVVTGTGVAQDKALPGFRPPGSDSRAEISKAARKTLDEVEHVVAGC
ncbi:hypothetical protein B0I37DRAFT_356319 [Chaetomium sp. MPI-CAGE-AT-0009]|nr:hypothetical protein B0I37DRAFT_356319 [Chaetomium sp. MPI-CAGE-AT-0009]